MSSRGTFFGRRGDAGFSVLEGVIGAVVASSVLYALSAGMLNSMRMGKSVEMKTEVNDFHQLLALSLSSSENAMNMLQAGGEVKSPALPTTFNELPQKGCISRTSTALGTRCCDESPEALTERCPEVSFSRLKLVDGREYVAQSTVGRTLSFVSANLVLVNMTAEKVPANHATLPQRREYYARLRYSLARGSGQQGGLESYSKHYPMLVEIEKIDSGLRLVSAYGVGQNDDGPEVCERMGGIWLKNEQNKQYFPNERCHFGGQLELQTAEWPDLLDPNGATLNEIRPMECLYMSSGRTASYKCPGRPAGSKRAGWVCRYEKFSNGGGAWKYSYIQKYSGSVPVYGSGSTYNRLCSMGLVAARNNEIAVQLRFHEPLAEAWTPGATTFTATAGSVEEYLAESDRLHTVLSCQKQWDVDTWTTCVNPTDPDLARAGGLGACLFVRRGKVTSLAGLGIEVSGVPSANNISDYTGWVLVSTARTLNADATVTEAVGVPCYQVEVSPVAYTGARLTAPSFPVGATAADFKKVAQCIVKLPAAANTAGVTHRMTTLSCSKNAGLEGDPLTWTEISADESRLEDALSALQIQPPSRPFGTILRSTSTTLPPTNFSLTELTNFDAADLVRVAFDDLNGDGIPEDCLFKRSSTFWGAPGALSMTRPTSAGSWDNANIVNGAAVTGDSVIWNGLTLGTYFRVTQAGVIQTNLACTTRGALDAVTSWAGNDLVELRDKINSKLTAENLADSEYLTTNSCAYFRNVAINQRAEALSGTAINVNAQFLIPQDGSGCTALSTDPNCFFNAVSISTALDLNTPYPASPLAAPKESLSAADKNGIFTGWVWLRSGLPVRRFRTVQDAGGADRVIRYNPSLKKFYAESLSDGIPIQFGEIELYFNSGTNTWVPLPGTSAPAAGRHYYVPKGFFTQAMVRVSAPLTSAESTYISRRRPLNQLNGEVCTQGIRFRTDQ